MWVDDYTIETDKQIPKEWWVKEARQNDLRSHWLRYWSEIITVLHTFTENNR